MRQIHKLSCCLIVITTICWVTQGTQIVGVGRTHFGLLDLDTLAMKQLAPFPNITGYPNSDGAAYNHIDQLFIMCYSNYDTRQSVLASVSPTTGRAVSQVLVDGFYELVDFRYDEVAKVVYSYGFPSAGTTGTWHVIAIDLKTGSVKSLYDTGFVYLFYFLF